MTFRKPGEKLVTLQDYDAMPVGSEIIDLTGRLYCKLFNEMWQDVQQPDFLYTPEQMLRFAEGTDEVVNLPYTITK
jgi:cell fate regulator YaaT (PSP1 superfamily)